MKKKILASAIQSVIGVAAPLLVSSNIAYAQDNQQAIEEVTVTGSRIVRSSNLDSASQMVSLDRVQIENLSVQSVADVLRSSPLNTLGSFNERSGSSAQSNAHIDLRGLGDSRTLVLLNGRRMTGSPNAGASSININMIPMAAIERADIMADGGSAVYGSDAVAGVVNMMMRDSFDGVQFNVSYGDRSEDDGVEEGFNIIAGGEGERGSLFVAAEYSRRDPIFDSDRDYTAPSVTDANGNGYIDAYSGETNGYSYYGRSIALFDPNTKFDQVLAATSCPEAGGVWLGEVNADLDWGGESGTDTYCMYGYANAAANKAGLDRKSVYVSGKYDLSDRIEFYSTALVSQVKSFGRYAPPAANWDNMPADYSDVPFDIDALLADGSITEDYELTGLYRWTNIGTRDNEVTDIQMDFVGGLRGDISEDIKYDVYVQSSRYDSKEFGYYYLSIPGIDYVLSQGIDPFSPEGAGAMSATTTQDNYTAMTKVYAQLQFNIGDLFGAGDSYLLVGAEQFDTRYQNKYDRASESGFVGGSAGNSSSGNRDVTAVFAEAAIPVMSNMEVNAAVRYDDYSDFGSKVSPSLSVSYEVIESVTLRSRWSQGFRAPSLDQLYGPEQFSADFVKDYVRCEASDISPADCPTTQADTYYASNEDLDAESSETFSLGFNWEFTPGWSVDAGFWSVKVSDVVRQWTIQDLVYAEVAGVDFDTIPGLSVDRLTAGGRIDEAFSTYDNSGELNAEGLDIKLSGLVSSGVGTFTFDAFVAEQLSYEEKIYPTGFIQDVTGFYLNPTTRGQFALGWSLGSHSVGWVIDYIGPHAGGNEVSVNGDQITYSHSNDELDAWTTMTAHYSFDAGDIGIIKVGARNLTNEDPVLSSNGTFESDTYDLYDNTGRVLFVDYTVKF
ncbi:Vitamin B12 transporter BtuB [Thalassocella blandensis]|nr:Vitamin B12 transporter BtuB [Thalassocella blandensis]